VEKKGSFAWVYDKAKFKFVVIGSVMLTPGEVGWDDIKVGSLGQIGPAPKLPSPKP
jgi:hypothetical protein